MFHKHILFTSTCLRIYMYICNITEQFFVEYGRQVKHTFVDSLFGGYLMSTVTCEECKNVSFHKADVL